MELLCHLLVNINFYSFVLLQHFQAECDLNTTLSLIKLAELLFEQLYNPPKQAYNFTTLNSALLRKTRPGDSCSHQVGSVVTY